MSQFFAVVVYRGVVAGKPTGSLDFQTRRFELGTESEVVSALENEEPFNYQNGDGEEVKWEFRRVMAIAEVGRCDPGDEVVGFIAKIEELQDLL